ncbi:hypothetical protein NQ315_012646 [Exocentrus adspersus]|uniref:PHD-type domain-containing protein n=1 Tax=Exocentrus adspersus TaxID=1586481 RepID=A0AAV8VSE9_9CUCU|nr:hypothetical protein NQ315_012646 [Exocentrus adspersus]
MTSVISHVQAYRLKKSVPERQTAVPDSTTIERDMSDFCLGQEVLVKQKDDRYYFGTVVQVNAVGEQCLVKFGDNTYNWSGYKDLTKLSTSEQEDLLCVVCKKSAPKSKREIVVCDKCGRGYHHGCHQAGIPITCQKEGSTWLCKRCLDSEPQRLKKNDVKHQRRDSLRSVSSSSVHDVVQTSPSSTVKVLPYDLNSLNWDTYHRVNAEQIYCYCGGNGEWYKQMLQCGRCRQWFHEKCLDCLQYPLYCGDRFYVFVCSICNQGKDFLRRLEMKWVDLVHLMLFNLTAYNCKKYYDLDTVVIPYINDNWHALQLPPKIANVSKSERRENILSVLTNNRNRFKCGREIKKRTTIWGLRVRLPPPAPCVTLPASGMVTEGELREMWQGNRRLQFLPLDKTTSTKRIIPTDAHMKSLMMGVAYQQNSTHSETDSPCPSPEIGREEPVVESIVQKNEFLGAGCAKKSVPFKKMSLQRRKKLLAMSNRDRERLLKRPKRKVTTNEATETQSKRLSLDSTSNKTSRSNEALPPTPPTSVSAPPTPPASNSTSIVSDLSNDFLENSTTLTKVISMKKSSLLDLPSELTTPCDTSGDETSSKSTLDAIIPPPKDFEGKNNPFLALLKMASEDRQTKKKKKKNKEITLPLPLTAVIPGKPVMRPTKRQLSEKDIVIGPNGQVKRKRFRRSRNLNVNYTVGQTASKTAAVVPARPDGKEWGQRSAQTQGNSQIGNCMDYALNGRRLRQRPERVLPPEKEKTSNPPTPKPSPVKQEPDIDMDDLKSSVNIYFGAANRIAAGERFCVKAKRIGPTGKMEYLIEWEGPSNGMT